MNKDITTKRILIYLAVTFIITYLFEFFVMLNNIDDKNISQILLSTTGVGAMLLPALSVVITRAVTKEGFKDTLLKPYFDNKKIVFYIIAWVGPAILVILGAMLYFICVPADYSNNMEYLMNVMAKNGTATTPEALRTLMISQTVTSIFLAPLLNCITCFGEEWGWRGYLLPKLLSKMSVLKAIIISGVIWGLWHMPLIIMGHNYGMGYKFYPYAGILAMCIFCIFTGAFFSFVTIKTNCCIPAIIGHGALNGIASVGIYFSKSGGNPFVGPSAVGIIGGLPLIITSLIMMVLLVKENKEKK